MKVGPLGDCVKWANQNDQYNYLKPVRSVGAQVLRVCRHLCGTSSMDEDDFSRMYGRSSAVSRRYNRQVGDESLHLASQSAGHHRSFTAIVLRGP